MAQKMEKLPNKTPRPIAGHKPAAAVLRDVVDKVYANAWEAKRRGELVGWSSSKFPIELAKAFDYFPACIYFWCANRAAPIAPFNWQYLLV